MHTIPPHLEPTDSTTYAHTRTETQVSSKFAGGPYYIIAQSKTCERTEGHYIFGTCETTGGPRTGAIFGVKTMDSAELNFGGELRDWSYYEDKKCVTTTNDRRPQQQHPHCRRQC